MNHNQSRCLEFIKGYIASNGYSPSYQEIADYLGLASKSSVFTIVRVLKDEGYINVAKRGQRNIRLTECQNCKKLEEQLKIAVEDLYVIAHNRSLGFNYIEYATKSLESIQKVK